MGNIETIPILPVNLLHNFNHTKIKKCCNLNDNHKMYIKNLEFQFDIPIYNLESGLYKIIINNVKYIIDIYFNLIDGDFLLIKGLHNINIYRSLNKYPVIAYRIDVNNKVDSNSHSHTINNTINGSIDSIMITGNTVYDGDPYISDPVDINRTKCINIKTSNNDNIYNLDIPLKHTLGSSSSGKKDIIIINANQLIAHEIIYTTKSILSGGLNWQYKENLSDNNYYVFFAQFKTGSSKIRCSHFKFVNYNDLQSSNMNCISCNKNNGIYIKINRSNIDLFKADILSQKIKMWLFEQSNNKPVYIEYDLENPIHNTVLLDEYHVKTWYNSTNIQIADNDFSVFYSYMGRD